MAYYVVAEFLLTSVSRSPSAIAERRFLLLIAAHQVARRIVSQLHRQNTDKQTDGQTHDDDMYRA